MNLVFSIINLSFCFSMGNSLFANPDECFQQLQAKYGHDAMKLISSQAAKQIVQQKYKDMIKKLQEYSEVIILKNHLDIDDYSKDIKDNFQIAKHQMDQLFPNGIPFLPQFKGENINQIVRIDQFITALANSKKQLSLKVNEQRDKIEKEIIQKKKLIFNQIEKSCPKITEYQQLSSSVKLKIVKIGEKKYKSQVDKNNQSIQKSANIKFNEVFVKMQSFCIYINPLTYLKSPFQNQNQSI